MPNLSPYRALPVEPGLYCVFSEDLADYWNVVVVTRNSCEVEEQTNSVGQLYVEGGMQAGGRGRRFPLEEYPQLLWHGPLKIPGFLDVQKIVGITPRRPIL